MADAQGHDPKLPVGTQYCQCPACREYFASDYAFSWHRRGDDDHRKCLSPREMTAKGMARNTTGYWVSRLQQPGVKNGKV